MFISWRCHSKHECETCKQLIKDIEHLKDYGWFTTSWESFNEIEKNAGHNGIRKEDDKYKYLLITYEGEIETYRYKKC